MRHLDTTIVVAYLRGEKALADQIKAHLPDIAISAIALAELEFGARASKRPTENLAKLAEFVELAPVVSFDGACASRYGEIRNQLKLAGRPIGETDTLIAAIAVVHQATIVTRNRRHFEQIEGLQVEEW